MRRDAAAESGSERRQGYSEGVIGSLRAILREPVLLCPVLILESDDWGPGPEEDSLLLDRLASLLSRYRDREGRTAVVTLGLTLAIPESCGPSAPVSYRRQLLSHPRFACILKSIKSGVDRHVFALQLHGMEHYWPPALTAAAAGNSDVREWLRQSMPRTEDLPSALQSRWIDASTLPSRPISTEEIKAAVHEETQEFARIFGRVPEVVVPPTFVWDERVEAEWASAGVRVVVTPGRRYEARDALSKLQHCGTWIRNGTVSKTGVRYMVRNDYFEPRLGHRAADGAAAVERKLRAGRPALLEMHRFNFVRRRDNFDVDRSFQELERLLDLILKRFPDVRFLSTLELADRITARDTSLVERRWSNCWRPWLLRATEHVGTRSIPPAIRRLARHRLIERPLSGDDVSR